MKTLAIALLLFSGCSSSQLVYECERESYGETVHTYIVAGSIDKALSFYETQTYTKDFYCHEKTWTDPKNYGNRGEYSCSDESWDRCANFKLDPRACGCKDLR